MSFSMYPTPVLPLLVSCVSPPRLCHWSSSLHTLCCFSSCTSSIGTASESQWCLADPKHNTQNRQTSMPLMGFEPTISPGERPKTYALDRAATGTGLFDPRTVQPLASRYTDWAIPVDYEDVKPWSFLYSSIDECSEHSGSITDPVKFRGFLEYLKVCLLLKKGSASWNSEWQI